VSGGTLVLLAGFLSAAVAFVLVVRLRQVPAPRAVNYRGERIPVVLGVAVAAGLTVAIVAAAAVDAREHRLFPSSKAALEILGSVLLAFGGGLVDDLQPSRTHGLLLHVRALLRGRVTTGILKLAVTVVAAAAFGVATRQHGLRLALCIAVASGAANLWNLLDVVPGRAIKWFLPAGAVALGLRPTYGFAPFESAALGAAVVALAVVVVLHVLAETVSLSRLIRAAPPLRWFDDLGRLGEEDLPKESAPRA